MLINEILELTSLILSLIGLLSILKQVPYKDIFVFLLAPPEPDEPPTFFKVDKNTGKFTDFSPWNEPDPESLEKALLA